MELFVVIAFVVVIGSIVAYVAHSVATDPMRLEKGSYWPPLHSEDFSNLGRALTGRSAKTQEDTNLSV